MLVDDEALARRRLRAMLESAEDIVIVRECENGADAVRGIREVHPDLVFLDVQMPELDGFDVITAIGPAEMPPVIFITAFDDYAVAAFEQGAVDYLLKPVEQKRFSQTLDRARERIRDHPSELTAQMAALIRYVQRPPVSATPERLGIKVAGKILFLDPEDIFWIQSRDDYARIHLADSFHDVREPLGHLEARLPPGRFLRVHRSAILNTAKIKEVEPFDQGDQLVLLSNGKRVTTGRSYRKAVQEFLKQAT